MADVIGSMIGKGVEVDGVHVGQAMNFVIEHSCDNLPKMTIEVVMTKEALEKLSEYEYFLNVMEGR